MSAGGRSRRAAAIDRRGFTLLELMLVMAVMGLALGLGLPRIGAVREAYLAPYGTPARRAAIATFLKMGIEYSGSRRAATVLSISASRARAGESGCGRQQARGW